MEVHIANACGFSDQAHLVLVIHGHDSRLQYAGRSSEPILFGGPHTHPILPTRRSSRSACPVKTSFHTLSTVAALTCALLCLSWLFAPSLLFALWQVDASPGAELVGRRSGALFGGLAIMFMQLRATGASPARSALSTGFAYSCFALACLGWREWTLGNAGAGIFLAVAVELLFAVAFATVAARDRALLGQERPSATDGSYKR